MPEKKYILPESYTKCLIWNHYCLVIYYMLNVTIPDSLTFGWFTPKLDVTLLTFKNSAAGLWMSQFRHSRRVQLQDCSTGLKIVLYLALKMLVDNSEKCKVESSPIHQQSECRNTLDPPPCTLHCTLCKVCKVCAHCAVCAKCAHCVYTVLCKVCVKCVHTVLCVTWQHLFARPIVTWQQCAQSNRK